MHFSAASLAIAPVKPQGIQKDRLLSLNIATDAADGIHRISADFSHLSNLR